MTFASFRWKTLGVMLLLIVLTPLVQAAEPRWQPETIATPAVAQLASPSCTRLDAEHLECFVVGSDLRVWTIGWSAAASWSGWQDLAMGNLRADPEGGVSAVFQGARLRVFVVALEGNTRVLYVRSRVGATWGNWQNLGRPPAVDLFEIACGGNEASTTTAVYCYARGDDMQLWFLPLNGTDPPAWQSGGPIPSRFSYGGLATTFYRTGVFSAPMLVAIGGDGNAYMLDGSWQNTGRPDSFYLNQVGCHLLDSNTVDCAFTDTAGGVWHRRYNRDSGWGNFSTLGVPPMTNADGITLAHYAGSGMVVLVTGRDGQVYRRFLAPETTTWSPWISHGRPRDLQVFIPLLQR